MLTNVQGRVVGISDESWGGGDKPVGRRVLLFVQQHEEGRMEPTKVTVDPPHYDSMRGVSFGLFVQVECSARPWQEGKGAILLLKSVGPVKVLAPAEHA